MKCDHCGGIMVHEKICNRSGESECWRCILCGEYVDQVIFENRQYQRTNRENEGANKKDPTDGAHEEEPAPLTYEDIMNFFSTD